MKVWWSSHLRGSPQKLDNPSIDSSISQPNVEEIAQVITQGNLVLSPSEDATPDLAARFFKLEEVIATQYEAEIEMLKGKIGLLEKEVAWLNMDALARENLLRALQEKVETLEIDNGRQLQLQEKV